MKPRLLFLAALLFVFISGCMVFSFYPLYTEEDLFPNDLLVGEWVDSDSAIWKFEHKPKSKWSFGGEIKVDSTAYILRIKEKEDKDYNKATLIVRIIILEGNYFLDFYPEDHMDSGQSDLFDLHLIPVHTFAKMEIENGQAKISWFDPQWLGKLIEKNKIRIHYETNGEHILLTAKPKELQKFVVKYVNSDEAFSDGYVVEMTRQ